MFQRPVLFISWALGVLALISAESTIGSHGSLGAVNHVLDNVRSSLEGNLGSLVPKLSEQQYRQLDSDGYFKLCAENFDDPSTNNKNHIIVNVNAKNKPTLQWVRYGDASNFCVYIYLDENKCDVALWGKVVPQKAKDDSDILYIHALFNSSVDYTSCYCASEAIAGSPPNYKNIAKRCTLQTYMDRDPVYDSLLFCPSCDECQQAFKKRKKIGTPDPVYKDWKFFDNVVGHLWGPGLPLFRKTIAESFDQVDPNINACTLDITNVPRPQFGCDDLSNPDMGYGFGANVKNMNCGLGTWFNCKEDLEALGGSMVKVHVADINLNVIPCPTPAPTPIGTCKNFTISEQICIEEGGTFCPSPSPALV